MTKVARQGNITIQGGRDFQRDLRAVDSKWPRELRKGLKDAAELPAARARRNAAAAGGSLSHGPVVDSIKAQAEQRAAKISWGGARVPMANGAIMGSTQFAQFRPWVGNTWDVGVRGQGPYAINDAVADTEDELVEAIGDLFEDVTRHAFPH